MDTTALNSALLALDPAGKPTSTMAIVRNMTSSQRQATIVAAGAHFLYFERGDYLAGPVPVELPSGASAPFTSSDPRRMVTSVIVGVTVRFGSSDGQKPPQYMQFFAAHTASGDKRLVELVFEFRTCTEAPNTVASAADWYELVCKAT